MPESSMSRRFVAAGAFSGGIAVALGAFAAHGLKIRLVPELLAAFETGARYQMYHALALTGTRAWGAVTPFGGVCFLAGWACLAAAAWKR